MQPAPGRPGLHSGLDSFRFNTNSSLSTAGSILRRNQCLSMAACFQIRRYAARALCGPCPALAPVLPGRRFRVETLYQSSTNSNPPLSPPPEKASASEFSKLSLHKRLDVLYWVLTLAAHANQQDKVSKRVENTWKRLNMSATMLQNRQVFLSEKERYSNPFERGPLTLRMNSFLDARGHYGWLHPWLPK
jgi:hypothetical protein